MQDKMSETKETLRDYIDRQTIDSAESFAAAVGDLRRFGRLVWIAAAVGAISPAFASDRSEYFSDAMKTAFRAAENWLAAPTDENFEIARNAQFNPGRLWGNCNDFRHVTTYALVRLTRAFTENDEESFNASVAAAKAMTHPLVFEEKEIWRGIEGRIRVLMNSCQFQHSNQ